MFRAKRLRFSLQQRQVLPNSPYDTMVLESHDAPEIVNIVAAASNWFFLAGFIFFPGTFTSIGHSASLGGTEAGRLIQSAVQNIPLLVIGCLSCCAGSAGLAWSSHKMKSNYVWLVDRIFMYVVKVSTAS